MVLIRDSSADQLCEEHSWNHVSTSAAVLAAANSEMKVFELVRADAQPSGVK